MANSTVHIPLSKIHILDEIRFERSLIKFNDENFIMYALHLLDNWETTRESNRNVFTQVFINKSEDFIQHTFNKLQEKYESTDERYVKQRYSTIIDYLTTVVEHKRLTDKLHKIPISTKDSHIKI